MTTILALLHPKEIKSVFSFNLYVRYFLDAFFFYLYYGPSLKLRHPMVASCRFGHVWGWVKPKPCWWVRLPRSLSICDGQCSSFSRTCCVVTSSWHPLTAVGWIYTICERKNVGGMSSAEEQYGLFQLFLGSQGMFWLLPCIPSQTPAFCIHLGVKT